MDGSRRSSTFESSERILCSDYVGFRNYDFLRAVDQVDDQSSVAIITHRACGGLTPTSWRGCSGRRGRILARRCRRLLDLPQLRGAGARHADRSGRMGDARVGRAEAARLALDRRVWTRWAVPSGPASGLKSIWGSPTPSPSWPRRRALGQRRAKGAPGRDLRRRIDVADRGHGREVFPGLHWWKGTRGSMRAGG